MFYEFTVEIASVEGKKVIQKKKGSKNQYVLLETSRTYDPKKKVTLPRRVCIGRVCEKDPSLMYPNEKFLKLFPSFVVPEERQEAGRSCCLKVGTYMVIKAVLKEQGLDKILEQRLQGKAGLFMDLMAYLIVDEDNAGQYYPDYAYNHPLFTPNMKIFSDATVSRLFHDIDMDQIIGFLDDWNKEQDHRQRIYISYDSTNKNCQAGDIDILEFGHAKDDKNIPIFNLAVAYDKTNKKPLFFEQYPGSICDVTQLKYLIDKVKTYGYKHIGFVLDRGYFSRDNIRYMDKNGYQFILMVKGCKPLVSSLIEARRGKFEEDRTCHIPATSVYGTTIEAPLFSEDKQRFFHLYYKPEKAAFERWALEKKLENMSAALRECLGKEVPADSAFSHYFDLTKDDASCLVTFSEKQDVVTRELRLCGYFCIVSSEKMSATDAYFLYKGRDPSEKLFRADKTFIGSRSMRVHSKESLSAKVWLEFCALIIRNRIYNLLKDEMIRLKVKKNFMTVPAAVKELDKIEMVRRNGGLYRLDHGISSTQKIILRSFGLTINDVRAEAAAIANTLAMAEKMKKQEPTGDEDAETEIDEDDRYEDFCDEI